VSIDGFGLNGPLSFLRNLGIDPEMLAARAQQVDLDGDGIPDVLGMPIADFSSFFDGGELPAAHMPAPHSENCPCPQRYASGNGPAFADMANMSPSLAALMQQGQPAMFMEFMRTNPFARQQLEMMLGGRIMPGDLSDSAMQVVPFTMGAAPAMPQGAAYSSLAAMQQEAMMLGFMSGQNMFQGAMLSALSAAASPAHHATRKKKKKKKAAKGVRRGQVSHARTNPAPNGRGGAGGGSRAFSAGSPGPHQGAFGLGRSGGDDVSAVLNDPTLTVEDKVTLMIMLIMQKMDKDIEKQAQSINKLQQQQNGGGGAGGGKGGLDGAPSIDVETMKLKRLIDKRSQMFDMLRQIIDKYNQTAKGIIDTIGR
jgi:hypothetical protein